MYNLVVCGGTFDRLHIGHMSFLDTIFDISKKVVIGLTSDMYISKCKPEKSVESYAVRFRELQNFLTERGYLSRCQIISIDDLYGKTLDKAYPFEAIAITDLTKDGAVKINQKRKELGLAELQITTVPLLITEKGVTLSSTLIRSGKMGRNGQFFPNPKWSKHMLHVPENIRALLHKPFGILKKEIPYSVLSQEKIITVGDATTKKFLEKGIIPKLSVIDFVVERKRVYEKIEDIGFQGNEVVYKSQNSAGSITPDVWKSLDEIDRRLSESHNFVLQINGEEDLLVIPLVLLLPLGYIIFYGQPHEGVVMVEVNEETKQHVFSLLQEFTAES